MINFFQYINKSKYTFFFFFLIIIFFFRGVNLYFSLSYYPWYYEWQHIPIFLEIQRNDYDFLLEHGNRNQYQIFTKILYLFFFKIFNNIWYPKFSTIALQIIPSLTLALLATTLFFNKIKSVILFVILIIALCVPASLANFYHFSESHFYFQLLLIILFFLNYKNNFNSSIVFISYSVLLITFMAFNMAALSISVFLTFIIFFLLKFAFSFRAKFFYYFLFFCITLVMYYYVNLELKVSSIYNTSDHADFEIRKFAYTFLKGLFHQNMLVVGLVFFLILLSTPNRQSVKRLFLNDFTLIILIYLVVILSSISFGKGKIYDRYKDILQFGSVLSIFLLNEINIGKLKIIKFIVLVNVIYNFAHFEKKVFINSKISKNYDLSISRYAISLDDKILSDDQNNNVLHYLAQRFPKSIQLSYSNKILKFKELQTKHKLHNK